MAELRKLADLARNGRERIRISLSEYRGARFADVRVFATNGDGASVPTKQGVTLRRDQLRGAIQTLEEAERLLQSEEAHS